MNSLNELGQSIGSALKAGEPVVLPLKQAAPFSPNDACSVLREMATKPFTRENRRIYVNGELRMDLSPKLHANPPEVGEDLQGWAGRLFGQDEFCVILNNCGIHDDSLMPRASKVVEAFVESHSPPVMGLDMVMFIGNYRESPLGVHIDPHVSGVVHFVAGPGRKFFYVWEPGSEKFSGEWARGHRKLEELRASATVCEAPPGSIFVLPASRYFHCAATAGVSVDLTIGVTRLEGAGLVRRALSMAIPHLSSLYGLSVEFRGSPSEAISTGVVVRCAEKPNLEQFLQHAVECYVKQVKSNGWFQFATARLNDNSLRDGAYVLTKPFALETVHLGKITKAIFCRGHSFPGLPNERTDDLVQALNRREPVRMSELNPENQALLTELHRVRALTRVDDPAPSNV